jgi:hypothetical protein
MSNTGAGLDGEKEEAPVWVFAAATAMDIECSS